MSLVVTRAEAVSAVAGWRGAGLSTGYTSGVFDLLHAGHLDYLLKAKGHCDRLVVGVNSDASVRRNKGPARPVIPAAERAALVAGLKPVDLVFIFDEANNNENIRTLKPEVYIKAGDYDKARLSSAPLIEAYGGRVELIPVVNQTSTSRLIEEAAARSAGLVPLPRPLPPRPAVFLDRDGVINEEVEYLHRVEEFRLTPNCLEGLARLATAEFYLVVVTNQAGIGLGYFDHRDFYKVNRAMFRAVAGTGASFAKVYYCPHSVAEQCLCRKPATGMLEAACRDLPIIREKSWLVGDREGDIEAGRSFGLQTVLITPTRRPEIPAHHEAPDLLAAARIIVPETPPR